MWTTTTLIDDEAIERRRHIGTIASAEGHEHLHIEVVRRDEVTCTDNGYLERPGRAEISIAGVHVLETDARALATMLVTAADDAANCEPVTGEQIAVLK